MKKTIALVLCVLTCLSLCACGALPETTKDGKPQYTLRFDLAALPTCWNPFSEAADSGSPFSDYLSAGLYAYRYNEARDGFSILPYAASELPKDVTEQYIGSYGIEADAEGRAYSIPLRGDLKWQDGTAIRAQDYVTSAEYLEAPGSDNALAAMFLDEELSVHNAENYFRQGQTVYLENSTDEIGSIAQLTANGDGTYSMPDGSAAYLAVGMPLRQTGGFSLREYVDSYGQKYFDLTNWQALSDLADANGLVSLTDNSLALLTSVTTGNPAWGETDADVFNYIVSPYTYPKISWSDVGIFAVNDSELIIILDKPLSAYALATALTRSWLVNIPMFESCASDGGAKPGSFCTGAANTVSFGPYMISEYTPDKSCTLVQNPYFFGFSDAYMSDEFEATAISIECNAGSEKRLQRFLDGRTDIYVLSPQDMPQYASVGQCVCAPESTTCLAALCPDFQALEHAQEAAGECINKTILSIPEFREALSLALDRSCFFPDSITAAPAFSIFSPAAVDDTNTGEMYAPDPGLSGYNLAKARELINIAYDKAIQSGYMDGIDTVEISAAIADEDVFEFLSDSWSSAAEGTKLTGRLSLVPCADGVKAEPDSLGHGAEVVVDSGWSYDATDPYTALNALVSPNGPYGTAIDYTRSYMSFAIDDVPFSASIWSWSCALLGETIDLTGDDGSTLSFSCGEDFSLRTGLLRALEKAIVSDASIIPLMYPVSAALFGQKIAYPASGYVYGAGFGGIRELKFNYSDAEWRSAKLTNEIK